MSILSDKNSLLSFVNEMNEPSISIPVVLQPWVYANTEFKQLVCKTCQRAIRPPNLLRHLQKEDKIGRGSRTNIPVQKFIANWASIDEPEEAIPEDGLAPQPHIRVVQQTKCRQCPFIPFTSDEEAEDIGHHWKITSHTGLVTGPVQTWYGLDDAKGWSVDMTSDKINREIGRHKLKLSVAGPAKECISDGSWHEEAKDFREHAPTASEQGKTDGEFESIDADEWAIGGVEVFVDGHSDACKDEDEFVMV